MNFTATCHNDTRSKVFNLSTSFLASEQDLNLPLLNLIDPYNIMHPFKDLPITPSMISHDYLVQSILYSFSMCVSEPLTSHFVIPRDYLNILNTFDRLLLFFSNQDVAMMRQLCEESA